MLPQWLTNLFGGGEREYISPVANKTKWADMGGGVRIGYENVSPEQAKSIMAEQEKPQRKPYESYDSEVRDLYKNQLGSMVRDTINLDEYFPVMQELPYIYEKSEDLREGIPELLALQALFESTGGRANAETNRNLFGTLPTGEGGEPSQFSSFRDSVDYQLGPNVLGGGANPNMNILSGEGAITEADIRKLYESYNPSGDYLETLVKYYLQLMDR